MSNALTSVPVSVIIPCYLAYPFLERAVNSLLAQSIKPAELILIDDASPDGGKTKNLIATLAEQINKTFVEISVVSIYLQENGGPGGARNAGWERATQPWIAFLDADDIWDPHKLELQYQLLQLNPSIDLLAHKSQFIKINTSFSKKIFMADSIRIYKVDLKKMLISNLFPARSVMLRSEIPIRFPSRTESEDYSLWLHIVARGYDVRFMDYVLAYTFRPEFSKGGYSGQLWSQEKRELHTLLTIYKDGYINTLLFLIIVVWSLSKFMRRMLIKLVNYRVD